MKTRKALFVLFMVGCLLAGFVMEAAAISWYTCTIDKVGPYLLDELTNGSHIYLTHDDASPAWQGSKKHLISPNRGKEYLAAALSAFASGYRVEVYINVAAGLPTIYGLYVKK